MLREKKFINVCFKWYKKIIYEINYKKIEMIFLIRKNIQQILRFIMFETFATIEFDITIFIEKFFTIRFSLLKFLFSKFQQQKFFDDDEFAMNIIDNFLHHDFAIQNFLFQKQSIFNMFSLRIDKTNANFKHNLFEIYRRDYNYHNIYDFENVKLKWCKKFNFNDV